MTNETQNLVGGEGVERIAFNGAKEPHRVAIIQDWGVGRQPLYDQYDASRLAFEEATASGLLDRPVELKIVELEAPPYMRATTMERRLLEIVREFEPIALIGPHTTETLPPLKPTIEALGISTIVQTGSAAGAGPHIFATQNGSFADEATILVDWLADQGFTRIGILREDNPLGDEYGAYARARARSRKVEVVADVSLPTFMTLENATAAMDELKTAGVQGYLYGGLGFSASYVMKAALTAMANGWNPPRILGSIYMGTIPNLGYGFTPEIFEGWAGVDQYDENNPVFMSLLDRFEKRFGRRPMHCYTAQGYDMANFVAHGLAIAKPMTRAGLRDALERVKRLPAAAGGPGTMMTAGPYDHRTYKGPFISLRRMHEGVNQLIKSV